ncbi:Pentatricopeptide repeat-containing protein [Nymphaea thermarum]|nr:Pentatricopeptide repeat-containing protein [Nymphaea thermarum]
MSGQAAERRILSALHGRKSRTHLTEILAQFVRHGLDQSNLVISHFAAVCSSFSRMRYARLLFDRMKNPNILLFNSMIRGYSQSGPFEESFRFFRDLQAREISPDDFTFPPLLRASCKLGSLCFGRGIHGQIEKVGFNAEGAVQVGLVELYVGCEHMADAQKVFDGMIRRNAIVWNVMIGGYFKSGNVGIALKMFDQMVERTIVSWNVVISGLAQKGLSDEALEMFRKLCEQGTKPDDATIVAVLPVCAQLGALKLGRWIHEKVVENRHKQNVSVMNALVDMYAKCGDLETARSVFNEIPQKNVVSWNSMIMGFSINGQGELAIKMFEEMKRSGTEPNSVTIIGVLTGCTHAGLVQTGREIFNSMERLHQIEPSLEHYGCMVDLLGRYGFLKEAHALIRSMPMKSNAAIWGALLSACRLHGNVELAEGATNKLIELEPSNSGNYVLLSNIYAEAGQWDESEKVRAMMKEMSIRKEPGNSAFSESVMVS